MVHVGLLGENPGVVAYSKHQLSQSWPHSLPHHVHTQEALTATVVPILPGTDVPGDAWEGWRGLLAYLGVHDEGMAREVVSRAQHILQVALAEVRRRDGSRR